MCVHRYSLFPSCYSLLAIPYRLFPIGYSLLAIAYWLLPIGCCAGLRFALPCRAGVPGEVPGGVGD